MTPPRVWRSRRCCRPCGQRRHSQGKLGEHRRRPAEYLPDTPFHEHHEVHLLPGLAAAAVKDRALVTLVDAGSGALALRHGETWLGHITGRPDLVLQPHFVWGRLLASCGQERSGWRQSVLAEVEGWAAEFERLVERISPRFARPEVRRRVVGFLRGLLGDVERKNGWQLAEQAGETTPDGMQRLLTSARWDADALRDDVRAYVVEHLGDPGGVLVVDETGFLKKGTKSAGVQRQYSGTAGRVENCQVGVFLTYASSKGRALVDRELYLPTQWAADPARRAQAHVPEQVGFHTKPQLAQQMLTRALDARVPAGWVTADEVYGGDARLRAFLEERDLAYVLAVKATQPLWATSEHGPAEVPACELVAGLPARAWRRLSAGDGAKGPRVYDWARVGLVRPGWPGRGFWLLARRRLSDGELAFYACFGPAGTTLAELVGVAGIRWAVEECFQAGKGQVGLDHYQVRRYDAWYRHTTLAMAAQGFLAAVRAQAGRAGAGGG